MDWSQRKPRPLALIGPVAVFSAEPIQRFLTGDDPYEILRRCGRRDEAWEEFYNSDLAVLKAMPPEPSSFGNDRRDWLVEAAESGLVGSEETFTLPFLNHQAQRELLEKRLGIDQHALEQTMAMLAESDTAPTGSEEELERLLENAAFRFIMRLVVPCFAQHQQTPQTKASQATDVADPNIDELKELLRLDAGFISDPRAQGVLSTSDIDVSNERFQYVSSALGRPSAPPTLKEMKCRLAGFVSFVGWVLGHPVQGPDIKALFDIRAQQLDPSSLGDIDLPVKESLTQSLGRHRARWIKRYHLDTNLLATVRALWGEPA